MTCKRLWGKALVWCSRSPGRTLGPVDKAQAIELLAATCARERRGLRSARSASGAGTRYAELERRYVVAGTSDERRETIFLGFENRCRMGAGRVAECA